MNPGQMPAPVMLIGCSEHDRQVKFSFHHSSVDDQLSFPAEVEVATGVVQNAGSS
jgi:hypothetical protein